MLQYQNKSKHIIYSFLRKLTFFSEIIVVIDYIGHFNWKIPKKNKSIILVSELNYHLKTRKSRSSKDLNFSRMKLELNLRNQWNFTSFFSQKWYKCWCKVDSYYCRDSKTNQRGYNDTFKEIRQVLSSLHSVWFYKKRCNFVCLSKIG